MTYAMNKRQIIVPFGSSLLITWQQPGGVTLEEERTLADGELASVRLPSTPVSAREDGAADDADADADTAQPPSPACPKCGAMDWHGPVYQYAAYAEDDALLRPDCLRWTCGWCTYVLKGPTLDRTRAL